MTFGAVKEPRPELDRKVSLVPRASPNEVKHHFRYNVEDQGRPRRPLSDARDQSVYLIALKVGEQALGRDEYRVRGVHRVKPTEIER